MLSIKFQLASENEEGTSETRIPREVRRTKTDRLGARCGARDWLGWANFIEQTKVTGKSKVRRGWDGLQCVRL